MNAHGISVFYGANDPGVALAEIRPPVGSKVAVARFEVVRPIQLLDLTALGDAISEGSVFDPDFISLLERTMFLRNLSHRITVPVMPEKEPFEYLPTQVITEFLAAEPSLGLDGIIFPSVQAVGEALNVVLFHKAARVENIELPAGAEISVDIGHRTEDGWEDDFSVIEESSPKTQEPEIGTESARPVLPSILPNYEHDLVEVRAGYDDRSTVLRIDLEAIYVEIVEGVKFATFKHVVRRHRFAKREFDAF